MGTSLRTLALALTCALLAALSLSACGGDDDSTSASSTAATEAETVESGAESGSGETTDQGSSEGSSDDEGSGSGDKGGVGGTGLDSSERSSKFVVPGGDNSIQEFGDEGDAAERAAALKAIEAVGKAGKSGDWNEVCGKYLAKKNLEQFQVIAAKIPKFQGKSCNEILHGLNPGRNIEDPTTPKNGVASIRADGENAFAIYTGVDGNAYAFPFLYEGDELKLTALAPTPLGGP